MIVSDTPQSSSAETGAAQLVSGQDDGFATIHLRELLDRLPARQREAVQLRYLAGLDYAQIAAAMGGSQQSARANVSQAMRKLQSMRR